MPRAASCGQCRDEEEMDPGSLHSRSGRWGSRKSDTLSLAGRPVTPAAWPEVVSSLPMNEQVRPCEESAGPCASRSSAPGVEPRPGCPGESRAVLGREGDGPGELRGPGAIAISSDGIVHVFDFAKGGFVRYGVDGTPLPLVRWPFAPPPNPQRLAAFSDSGVWAARVRSLEGGALVQQLAWMGARDTVVANEVRWPVLRMKSYPSCAGGMMALPPLFISEGPWAAGGEWVATEVGSGYAVDLYEGRSKRRSIRWNLPERRASADAALAEVGEQVRVRFGGAPPCDVPGREVVQVRGYLRTIPWIEAVAVSPDGEVWVRRHQVGEDAGPTDVFDNSGAYRGSLPPGTPFPLVFLDRDRFVALMRSEWDVERLLLIDVHRDRESSRLGGLEPTGSAHAW